MIALARRNRSGSLREQAEPDRYSSADFMDFFSPGLPELFVHEPHAM